VIGILRFQDQIILALSLASLLGNRACRRDPTMLLVVDTGRGQIVALDCEQVPRATSMPARILEQARQRQTDALGEIHTPDGQVLSLIDLPRLLSSMEGAGQ
jgi:purine-binding chemotaxis protein CheW